MENKNENENQKTKNEEIEKNEQLDNQNKGLSSIANSPKKESPKKRNSVYSKVYTDMMEKMTLKNVHNFSINDIDDNEIRNLFFLLERPSKLRKRKDNNDILIFLLKTKLKENLKSDLLYTDYNLDTLFSFIHPYITGNIYSNGEIIYSYGEEAENLYVLLKGRVGLYKFVTTEVHLTCEDYYSLLCDQFNHFKTTLLECKEKNDIFEEEKEYSDVDLLIKMVNKNKEIYPLFSFDDIEDLKKIMTDIKLYLILVENRPGNINDIYIKFNIPLTYSDYDKLVHKEITAKDFVQNLKKKIKKREKFYMKYLGKNDESNVSIMKYVKTANLKPFDYFGNFEMINTRPYRTDTARTESDFTILMTINKKAYSKNINAIQKDKREEEISYLHNSFYFKMINRVYFEKKLFIHYRIDNFFKGTVLINQGEKANKFIFIREGMVETSINNISLLELANKIIEIKDFIHKKAKEHNVNVKDVIDFDISLNQKTTLKYEVVEGIIKQKQNFIFSISERGSFGDYEYYFDTPSFITATLTSKESKIYFYEYEHFKRINEEVHSLNESLRSISFSKLKSILKRMITIYNSNFNLNITQLESKIKDNEDKLKKIDSSNKLNNNNDLYFHLNLEREKHFCSPITLFKKSNVNIFNLINKKNNEYAISREYLEKHRTLKKNKINSYLSFNFEKTGNLKERRNKKEQLKNEYNAFMKKVFNIKQNKKIVNSNSFSSDKISIENESMLNSFKDKKIFFMKSKNSKNSIFSKNKNSKKEMKLLKTENSEKRKLFDVFLPPLLTEENTKKLNKTKDEKEIINSQTINNNNYINKQSLSVANSINDTIFRKKYRRFWENYKNNNTNFPLSNFNEIKNKDSSSKTKSKSMDIKIAQITILKNRNQKRKLILKQKNDEEFFNEMNLY